MHACNLQRDAHASGKRGAVQTVGCSTDSAGVMAYCALGITQGTTHPCVDPPSTDGTDCTDGDSLTPVPAVSETGTMVVEAASKVVGKVPAVLEMTPAVLEMVPAVLERAAWPVMGRGGGGGGGGRFAGCMGLGVCA